MHHADVVDARHTRRVVVNDATYVHARCAPLHHRSLGMCHMCRTTQARAHLQVETDAEAQPPRLLHVPQSTVRCGHQGQRDTAHVGWHPAALTCLADDDDVQRVDLSHAHACVRVCMRACEQQNPACNSLHCTAQHNTRAVINRYKLTCTQCKLLLIEFFALGHPCTPNRQLGVGAPPHRKGSLTRPRRKQNILMCSEPLCSRYRSQFAIMAEQEQAGPSGPVDESAALLSSSVSCVPTPPRARARARRARVRHCLLSSASHLPPLAPASVCVRVSCARACVGRSGGAQHFTLDP